MKYYYLLNGKIMWSYERMPSHISLIANWHNSLQPCEISESELDKVKNYPPMSVMNLSRPIEVTEIVEERKIIIDNSKPIMKVLFFKQPKQVEEIEAVEFAEWTYVNWWTYNVMKGFWYNIGKQKTDKTYTTKQLYEIFKNQKQLIT